jgi:hypothetical protein
VNGWILLILGAAGVVLIGVGVWIEMGKKDEPAVSAVPRADGLGVRRLVREMIARHPAPALAVIETVFWVLVLITLALHMSSRREGSVAFVIWALTIGPHEAGHVICMPFGWFLNVAGGSIWQVLIFALPALYALAVRRQISGALFFWALAGHSLINLSVYIGDARARQLPLILGMSKDHHDWWNLLRDVGLLDYDRVLAAVVECAGAAIIVGAVGLGIVTAWLLPRTRSGSRYEGRFWAALRDRWRSLSPALGRRLDDVRRRGHLV